MKERKEERKKKKQGTYYWQITGEEIEKPIAAIDR